MLGQWINTTILLCLSSLKFLRRVPESPWKVLEFFGWKSVGVEKENRKAKNDLYPIPFLSLHFIPTFPKIQRQLRLPNVGVPLRAGHQVNCLAVRMTLPTWFDNNQSIIFSEGDTCQQSWQTCDTHFRSKLKFGVLVFLEGGTPENPEKNPPSRLKNQQTQTTGDTGSRNQTRAQQWEVSTLTTAPSLHPPSLI